MDISLDRGEKICIMVAMQTKQSKKNPVNFNDFWSALNLEAKRQQLGKGEWLRLSGLNYQRYSEFNHGNRDISAGYFIKLIGGLKLTTETAEKALGKKFTDSQRKLLRFEGQVDANREWLEKMFESPEVTQLCKSIVTTKTK